MTTHNPGGYVGTMLRVDLTTGQITKESFSETILRRYLGGAGLGMKLLYDEVPPGVEWSDPENRLTISTGPLTGTRVGGTGGICIVTKGALTNGATIAQSNGFLGAYLKFCGFDGIILQGASRKLSYLFIDEGYAEIRDATYLAGKDTWETEELIKHQLGKGERGMSVHSIGPAGENLVRFACLVGDKGHVAAHNGPGAVMGSKKLKAIAVARGKVGVKVENKEKLYTLANEMYQKLTSSPTFYLHKWGTEGDTNRCKERLSLGILPIKNYTTNIFPEYPKFGEDNIRAYPNFKFTRKPCWACKFDHCHLVEIQGGSFAGYVGEEPEYELWAGCGPLIGQVDFDAILVLANEIDRLGMDGNESCWIMAWIMECYEKRILTREDTDGLEMKWGNGEAVRAMLYKIAYREGFGNVLAEGVMRAAQRIGGDARELAIYTKKGNSPRMHDHRSLWPMMLDTCTSDIGRDEESPFSVKPETWGLAPNTDLFSAEGVATLVARMRGSLTFNNCLVICKLNTSTDPIYRGIKAELVSAATGWDFTEEEVSQVGLRVVNLLRAFNIRHGHTRDLDVPSARYSSTPTDGPNAGKSIAPVWDKAVDMYYELIGWDKNTAKPLPETLRKLGLEHVIPDIWTKST